MKSPFSLLKAGSVLTVLVFCAAVSGRLSAADEIPGSEFCRSVIENIRFVGNDVTRDAVLLRELPMRAGDACDLDDIIDGIQSLFDLELFTRVRTEIRPGLKGAIVRYIVEEKFFFLALPRLSRTSDGELRGGLQLRWDNFNGRLHEFRITAEQRRENDGNGHEGFVYSMDYRIPRFLDSGQGLSISVEDRRKQVSFERDGVDFGVGERDSERLDLVWLHWPGSSRGVLGLSLYGGIRFDNRRLSIVEGDTGPYRGGNDVTLVVGFENRQVHSDRFRRTGRSYGAQFQFANSVTGSDFRYHRLDLFGRWYLPLPGGVRNVNLQARLGLSDGAPFGERAYAIGGGELLRGMESDQASGDFLALLNVEYLQAWFTHPSLRWVLFSDVGNVYTRERSRLSRLYVRGGLGLRWKLLKITNTDIRLDLAWDPDAGRARTYVSTNLTY